MEADTRPKPHPKHMRRRFFAALFGHVRILWPIFSGVLAVMVVCGFVVGRIEEWPLGDALYFTFVTGLTIGYGDLTPQYPASRILAILIGFMGIVLTGLVAAVTVKALNDADPE